MGLFTERPTDEETFTRMIDASDVRWIRTRIAAPDGYHHKYLVMDDKSEHLGEWFFDANGMFLTAKGT